MTIRSRRQPANAIRRTPIQFAVHAWFSNVYLNSFIFSEYLKHAACLRATLFDDSRCGKHYRSLAGFISNETSGPSICWWVHFSSRLPSQRRRWLPLRATQNVCFSVRFRPDSVRPSCASDRKEKPQSSRVESGLARCPVGLYSITVPVIDDPSDCSFQPRALSGCPFKSPDWNVCRDPLA